MKKETMLGLRKELQDIKRKLYSLTNIKDLSNDKLSNIMKALKELETLSSKIGDPYESQ